MFPIHEERAIQFYKLTNSDNELIRSHSQRKYQETLMQVLFETNINHKDFRILLPKKNLPPRVYKQRFPSPKLRIFDVPNISDAPHHQPFCISKEGALAFVLEENALFILPPFCSEYDKIDLKDFHLITSIHTNEFLFAGSILGNVLLYDSQTHKEVSQKKSKYSIGPMTAFQPNVEIISNYHGSLFFLDARTKKNRKLYTASFPSPFSSISLHSSYLSFCNSNHCILLDIRSPKTPLKEHIGAFDRVSFNNQGLLGLGKKDLFSTLNPINLTEEKQAYSGSLCGLSAFDVNAFAAVRFQSNTKTISTELLTLTEQKLMIDRVIETRFADLPSVNHLSSYKQALFAVATNEENLKVWDFAVIKPPKKTVHSKLMLR